MTSLHSQTSLQTQICHAHCTLGKTSTSVDTALCLVDNYLLPGGKDRSLNVTNICNYCKNPGHLLANCKKFDDHVKKRLARRVHLTEESRKIEGPDPGI